MSEEDFVGEALKNSTLKGYTPEKAFGLKGRVIVGMNDGNLVRSSPDAKEVFTFGALGCNVVAIEGKRKGVNFGAIAHYDPTHIRRQILKIDEFGSEAGKGNEGGEDETRAEIFVRGTWEKVADKWKMKPENEREAALLESALKTSLGEDTKVKVTPYSTAKQVGYEGQGTVSVDISENPSRETRILGIF